MKHDDEDRIGYDTLDDDSREARIMTSVLAGLALCLFAGILWVGWMMLSGQ